ncbi:hypothetical protein [Sulfitobacter sp. JL08]|uniref:hypothetical protein n=2 Tax=unclassified Sulfitobacter TaxID=196795 RepID=UPI001962CFA5|nr:hypothetical protein [Sulfitobacter sp. JL08]
MSGTPSNDHFQVVENQMCSHRLFSMHANYAKAVMKWLDMVRQGIRTFDDYCQFNPSALGQLESADTDMRNLLRERRIDENWIPYSQALRTASARYDANWPRHIMLDSGAYTAWNAGKTATLEQITKVYAEFIENAVGLFDEIWLVNLDVIPGKPKRAATEDECKRAAEESDENLAVLKSEFGECVLPVFHQGDGKQRLLDVIDQGNGYICFSPTNGIAEKERWLWAVRMLHSLHTLRCDVQAHGLATTGNEMIREAYLHSGDSAAWKRHGGFGIVDLVEDERWLERHIEVGQDCEWLSLEINDATRPRYRAYHIARDRNDLDELTGEELIDNARHYTSLPKDIQLSVRSRVEQHFPMIMAQFDKRVRELICLAELRKFAESAGLPRPIPKVRIKRNGNWIDPGLPLSDLTTSKYPTQEDRESFLSHPFLEPL